MKARSAALCAILIWLLWVVNKGAYKGYFSGDELDIFAWMRYTTAGTFLWGFFTPQFYATNFRPLGHLLFWGLYKTVGLNYPWFLATVQLLHVVNLALLWRLLPGSWPARACGLFLFAFHIACFDDYWKSMTLFDVLCTTFCLAALIAWTRQRPWWSLLLFWCAYKSKELAIGLPVILLAYEYWLGEKRWRQLTPFFAVSFLFGLQAVFQQGGQQSAYGLRLNPTLLVQAIDFYASQILILPHLGFALLLIPLFTKDRRIWWGLATFLIFLAPMFLVPNRLLSSYLYLPLAGLAYAFAAFADRTNWRYAATLLLVWLPLNYALLPPLRSTLIAEANETKTYLASVFGLAKRQPELRTFLIDGQPPHLQSWGVTGALRLAFDSNEIETLSVDAHPASQAALALLSWDRPAQRLYTLSRIGEQQDAAWIEMTRLTPVWQLEKGWFGRDASFRWTAPYASARLWRPAEATSFQIEVNIGVPYLKEIGQVTLETKLNGEVLGRETFAKPGWRTLTYPLSAGPAAPAQVEFLVSPPFRPSNGDPRRLGIPIGAFGFR